MKLFSNIVVAPNALYAIILPAAGTEDSCKDTRKGLPISESQSEPFVTRRQSRWIRSCIDDLYHLAYGITCVSSENIGELVRFAYAVTEGPITRSMLEEATKHVGIQSKHNYLKLFLDTDFDDVCRQFASPGESTSLMASMASKISPLNDWRTGTWEATKRNI